MTLHNSPLLRIATRPDNTSTNSNVTALRQSRSGDCLSSSPTRYKVYRVLLLSALYIRTNPQPFPRTFDHHIPAQHLVRSPKSSSHPPRPTYLRRLLQPCQSPIRRTSAGLPPLKHVSSRLPPTPPPLPKPVPTRPPPARHLCQNPNTALLLPLCPKIPHSAYELVPTLLYPRKTPIQLLLK